MSAQHVLVLLFLVLAVNSNPFIIPHSYSSHLFLCALVVDDLTFLAEPYLLLLCVLFYCENHPQRNGYTWPVEIGMPIIPTTNQIGEWSPPHDKSLRAPLFTRVHKTNSLHCSQANYCLFNLTHLCRVLCNITWLWYRTYMCSGNSSYLHKCISLLCWLVKIRYIVHVPRETMYNVCLCEN